MSAPRSGSGGGSPIGKSQTAGSVTRIGSGFDAGSCCDTGTGIDSCGDLCGEPSGKAESSAKGEPLSSPACAPSLLSTHSFARYRKNAWERFDDIVTPEEAYGIVWQCHDSAQQNQSECHTRSGEAVLWAYPNDIEPLVVGHALLDLCPSAQSLSRNVHLTVDERGGVDGAPSSGNVLGNVAGSVSGNVAGKVAGASSGFSFGVSPEKIYRVTIGSPIKDPLPLPPLRWIPKDVLQAMDAFIEAEGLWESTGCFHRAGVYAMQGGALLTRVEDIGRHNCVDRLAGWSVLNRIPLSDKALLVSARMTSSLCAKAIRAGFPVIVSRSAVTTAAIAMAREAGVTLIGFARTQEQRFTVFSQGKCGIYDE